MGDQLDRIRREAEKKRRKEWKPADPPKQKTHLAYYPSREEMNEHEPEFYMWRDNEKKMKTSSRNEKVRQRFFIQWLCALGIFVVTAIVAQTNQALSNLFDKRPCSGTVRSFNLLRFLAGTKSSLADRLHYFLEM
ncbi:hypothetical protein [Geomicrobium sp. JCM 19039]|uniref:hypothetical protein n=1 Tax=Geomicrobium sp. JCM 19039 TaxID=1460636 RepID=UPI0006940FA2|nr:hypothetical protein [Geomicrobium sp. JCM 19039]